MVKVREWGVIYNDGDGDTFSEVHGKGNLTRASIPQPHLATYTLATEFPTMPFTSATPLFPLGSQCCVILYLFSSVWEEENQPNIFYTLKFYSQCHFSSENGAAM